MINKIVNNPKQRERVSIVLTGDVVLDVPDPDHWLGAVAGLLRAADVAIVHVEVPHTRRGSETGGDVPAPGADPDALLALQRSGVTVATLAGNHIADQGADGIDDTLVALDDAGIAACGAGVDLQHARRPALVEAGSRRIAIFSYNCVGPESSWAGQTRAGCAYLRVETSDGTPVAPLAPLVRAADDAAEVLASDIRSVRDEVDLVIVALHKGIVHTPVALAPYERPLAHAAIDHGADAVVGHHAHIVKGIEVYRGKPVFHGLGNGCVVTRALDPAQDHAARAAWARRRRELFGFEPDPAYELAPFHPEAVNAMFARFDWQPGTGLRFGILPVHVEPPGRPVPASQARSAQIAAYVERVTRDAGLPGIRLEQQADMWVVH